MLFYYSGNISHFNIWSHWRNVSEEFVSAVHNCSTGEFGDQVDWRLLKARSGVQGDVLVNIPDTCSSNSSKISTLNVNAKFMYSLLSSNSSKLISNCLNYNWSKESERYQFQNRSQFAGRAFRLALGLPRRNI